GALVSWVPAVARRAEREDALLGAALFFVAPRAAEGRVQAVFVERLLQGLGLHDMGMEGRARCDRADAAPDPVLVDMNDEVQVQPAGRGIAKPDTPPKLPGGVNVKQREGEGRGMERLYRKVQHHAGVLADRVKHH